MSNLDIDLLVHDGCWNNECSITTKLMEDIFKIVYGYLKIPMCNNIIEIAITLSDDENIQILNKDYRNKDKPTNVLTFSLYDNKDLIMKDLKKLPCMTLGDIIFSYDTIKKEAEEQSKTFKDHFIHMLIHSYLHLFGYDHIKENDRENMEKIEIRILKKLNIRNPYIIS